MLNIISGPCTYDGHADAKTKKLVKYLKTEKQEYSVYFSKTFEDLNKIVSELTTNSETEFIVVGDDVVIHEFLNSVFDISKIKFGIVQSGAKNDFSTYLEIPTSPIMSLKNILQKRVVGVDYLAVNNKLVLNNLVVGAGAELFEIVSKYKVKNFATEMYASIKYYNKFEGINLTIDTKSGKPKTETIFDLSIANGGLLYGKHISPLANLQDGLCNLNYCTDIQKQEKRKYFNAYYAGDQIYDDKTKLLWLNSVKLSCPEGSIKAVVDGKVETFENIEVIVKEKGLKIYM
ncbi:MAG: hypothetical protein MJ152_01140 [Clostridia bacterium]|nr:hypothetical protein [Clostridia bacterium]